MGHPHDDEDVLFWDAFSPPPPPRSKGTIHVSLKYLGRRQVPQGLGDEENDDMAASGRGEDGMMEMGQSAEEARENKMASDTKSIEIGLFLLERSETPQADEWGKCLVAAGSEKAARELANHESGSEGYIWTDGGRVEARRVGTAADGVDGVLIFSRD